MTNNDPQADFGDPTAEARAARETVAVIDVGDRSQLEMTGADRHSFLHNFCTQDIKALRVGAGSEAFLCNVKGRLLGHIFVFAGAESLWIECVPGQGVALRSHLERYHLLEDFLLTDRSQECGELLVAGPRAVETLVACGAGVAALQNWEHVAVSLPDVGADRVWIKRADVLGVPSYWISAPRAACVRLRELLGQHGALPAGRSALHELRIEARLPWYGIDLSDENLAQEANRTRAAISFAKGCYLGQEPVARIHALGHVNKEVTRFVIAGSTLPVAGTALVNPQDPSKEVGRLTSVVWSTARQQPIGLGIVRTAFAQPGSEVLVAGESPCAARAEA